MPELVEKGDRVNKKPPAKIGRELSIGVYLLINCPESLLATRTVGEHFLRDDRSLLVPLVSIGRRFDWLFSV
ncbi:MAG: hypothetical protein HC849_09160 [Oscillatoriales cyanobacterium RU_3_3]|nr:hypothetical protein [Oscillatoriales cyanobacterium RU_3_3]